MHRTKIDVEPDAATACQNCEWTGPGSYLNAIADLGERVTAGEKMPAGQCPRCGSLAHLITTRWRVSDSITFERVWYVDAASEEEAISVAERTPNAAEETQIDNTPWHAELASESESA